MPFEATFLLVRCSFLPRIFANLTGTLPPSLPGVRPPAWPGPKPRFSSCFWGVFILPGLLQYIYKYVCIDIYRHIIRYIQVICIYIYTCSYTYVYRYIVMLYTHMIIYGTGLQPHPPSHGHGPIPGPGPRPPVAMGGSLVCM